MVLCAPVVRVAPEVLPPPRRLLRSFSNERKRLLRTRRQLAGRGGGRHVRRRVWAPPPWFRVAGGPAGRVRLAVAAVFLSTTASSAAALQRVAPSVPLVLHGDADVRTTARNSEELVRRSAAPEETLRVKCGARHQLSRTRPAFTRDVVDWLKAHAMQAACRRAARDAQERASVRAVRFGCACWRAPCSSPCRQQQQHVVSWRTPRSQLRPHRCSLRRDGRAHSRRAASGYPSR
jgi:hypothetical protein